jgi:heat-inducible transcriptional repressor
MYDLTPRQVDILKLIVREYIDNAEAVGSETLEKKHDVGISPATIRNEMAAMVKLGYLSKPHTSAGRIPTTKALKLYINELMREKEVSVADEVQAKEHVWDLRAQEEKFLRGVTRDLAQKTRALAVTTTDDGDIYYSGYANILETPEFYDIDIAKNLLSILDSAVCFDLITKRIENELGVFLGDELGSDMYRPYSFVFSKFHTKNINGSIGVVGPARIRYELVIPTVRFFGGLIGEVAEW